ncbi:MAG: transcription-repair coupling factor, partial [Oligoflexia bacterium]|nr:transcription-repair coupling factor [Oligoflexia bacterium]
MVENLNMSFRFCKEINNYSAVSSIPLTGLAFYLVESMDSGTRLLVVPDPETAVNLLDAAEAVKPDIKGKICIFPEWDSRTGDHVSPGLQVQADRLAVLFRLMNDQEPVTVITTLAAISQHLPPMEYITDHSVVLREGMEIDENALAPALAGSGYQRMDVVEEAGTFSMRGNIIDIYSSSNKKPVRVELFGDIVESIKLFDPDSQRSVERIQSTCVTPVREISFSERSVSLFREKFKLHCDNNDIRKDNRNKLIEMVENGFYFPGIEYYLPFFFEELSVFFDYLPRNAEILTFDDCMFAVDAGAGTQGAEYDAEFPPYPLEDFFTEKSRIAGYVLDRSRSFYSMDLYDENKKTRSFKDIVCAQKKPVSSQGDVLDALQIYISQVRQEGMKSVFVCHTLAQAERLAFILKRHSGTLKIETGISLYDMVCKNGVTEDVIVVSGLSGGIRMIRDGISIITEDEIFGGKIKKAPPAAVQDTFLNLFRELRDNDYVVHSRHGVGIYRGLKKMVMDNVENDFFQIEYAGGDILYVPVYRLGTVQKFIAREGAGVKVDRLGGSSWEKKRNRAKKAAMDIAGHLLKLQAERKSRQGHAFAANDEMYYKFEAEFEFEETPDQYRAIKDVMEDMESVRSMDRLVCGDVGYGKTEVALRAAFKAVAGGRQVAVLVPTTILAFQHYQLFAKRLAGYPVTVEMLSRFRTRREQADIVARLRNREIDIIIGTHRLLSSDIAFADLGLLVIDEEQRFGVKHKEKIKEYSANVEILTMTATPIPRTLNMSLTGLKDISIINTPPVNRLPIKTYIARYSRNMIRNAVIFEMKRGGQVFFLHNRVVDIPEIHNDLSQIVPEARIIVAHGQMNERELEKKMLEFYNKKADVLLCTSIIESGLDIPNSNTIIINRADMFGLSQLYQIRGRVGRSSKRAYCYLLLPSSFDISREAMERLKVLQQFTELGSGFNVASHDLELRGAGELLGSAQSGFIDDIGFEEYLNLLEEAVSELKGESRQSFTEPEISINTPAFIPESYISGTTQRLY